jgi:hypothetical protein
MAGKTVFFLQQKQKQKMSEELEVLEDLEEVSAPKDFAMNANIISEDVGKSGFEYYYEEFREYRRIHRGPDPPEVVFGTLLQTWMAGEEEAEIPFDQITLRCK